MTFLNGGLAVCLKPLKVCFDPTILFLGIYSKKCTHGLVQIFIYKEVYFVLFIITKSLNDSNVYSWRIG